MKKMADIFMRRKLCLLVSGWDVTTPLFVHACQNTVILKYAALLYQPRDISDTLQRLANCRYLNRDIKNKFLVR